MDKQKQIATDLKQRNKRVQKKRIENKTKKKN